ncbi:glycosyltransferase family 9 protein [Campylobacter sp. RM16192]|uniref:glycosyltransferase family 9 protein n=1 Tax=Campylobacter sp. RM16192 TaxID=1660080 RepID=UPI00145260CD|nr:glycosyltransferase family 9 protein [Campylobacter sp. RM16192]QCD52067.1 glycosyltransferase, family 9 [Campylobacter sp. RM16192]
MIYLLIYFIFIPILFILSPFRSKKKQKLVIQTAKIGDYANSSIIFDIVKNFDIVIDSVNIDFANFDCRINNKFEINTIKNNFLKKIRLAFRLYFNGYSDVYVMMPNSLNLFLAQFSFAKNIKTIEHEFCSLTFKLLSFNMQKIRHDTSILTLISYLRMADQNIQHDFNHTLKLRHINLKFKKRIQDPLFVPKQPKINCSEKFKVGISLTARNKIKTPPSTTWNKIFKILNQFDVEVYIFGIKNEDSLLRDIDTQNVKIISMVDKLELKELPYHISKMDLYISADTGNYYIADSVSTPTICMMGPCFASEQRGVFNSLVIQSNLEPISSVFHTIREIDASRYFELNNKDEENIIDFIQSIDKHYC